MTWREHGGALWRPLVDVEGGVLDGPGAFARGIELATQPAHARLRDGWSEYPFNAPDRNGHRHGQSPWSVQREGDPGLKVRSHNREAAVADAQRIAADDLLVIDGVLHRRTTPPVWAVGCRSGALIDPGLVALAIPDLKEHDTWLASFPLDRREEALAFAREHVEYVNDHLRKGHAAQSGEELTIVGAQVRHAGGPYPDTRADDLRRAFEIIEDNFGGVELKRLGRRFLNAYGNLAGLVEDIAEAGREPAWPEGADAVVRDFADAGDPDWPNTWVYAAEIVECMRAFARRHEVTNRWDIEAEEASISGLAR